MAILTSKSEKRTRRHNRIRAKVQGTKERPRLSVFKSLKFVYAQVIDDDAGTTLVAVNSKDLKIKGSKLGAAEVVGKKIAEMAIAKGVKKVVFDRGGYLFTGIVKKVAESARTGGLEF